MWRWDWRTVFKDCVQSWFTVLRTNEPQWTVVVFFFFHCRLTSVFLFFLFFGWFVSPLLFDVTMPMKRSSESSARDGVFLIHSLTKTLCSSPEETRTDFNKQTHFHQEDDSGIKSGKFSIKYYFCWELRPIRLKPSVLYEYPSCIFTVIFSCFL